MELLLAIIIIAVAVRLVVRSHLARRVRRLNEALSAVEAVSALVLADWPATYRDELAVVLFREERLASAEYCHGMHTSVRARQDAYAHLQRIGHALDRVHEACRIVERSARRHAA